MSSPLETRIQELAPAVQLGEIRSVERSLEAMLIQPRFYALLMSFFAAVTLVLAFVGIYGVVSYSVSLRTHEIGLRMALGARLENVLRQVVVREMIPVIIGIAGGLVVSLLVFPTIFDAFFHGWKLREPTAPVVAPVLIALIALLAIWLPARRAARIDPAVALRQT